MSIYATLWTLKFPKFGYYDGITEWVELTCQSVPAHIGTPTPGYGYEAGDPYADFLPPAVTVDPIKDYDPYCVAPRTVVIIEDGCEKDNHRYINPLLVIPGQVYADMSFEKMQRLICDKLHEKYEAEYERECERREVKQD